jgi:hypothetical protein
MDLQRGLFGNLLDFFKARTIVNMSDKSVTVVIVSSSSHIMLGMRTLAPFDYWSPTIPDRYVTVDMYWNEKLNFFGQSRISHLSLLVIEDAKVKIEFLPDPLGEYIEPTEEDVILVKNSWMVFKKGKSDNLVCMEDQLAAFMESRYGRVHFVGKRHMRESQFKTACLLQLLNF